MKKGHFPISLIFFALVGLSLPISSAHAQGLPFGGLVSFTLPCTCSGNLAIWFTPLYLGGPVPVTGFLAYSPFSTIPYSHYKFGVPFTWHLGSYLPGVQACLMIVPKKGCVPFPVFGLINKVGTSFTIGGGSSGGLEGG